MDENKENLVFFEKASMKMLFSAMVIWQKENKKRLLSLSIHKDGNTFFCIALTNPSEVVICAGNEYDRSQARVSSGLLHVNEKG